MNKIKDTTGVSDIKEVVQRFLSQGETQKHLQQLKTNNEKMLVRLKEEKVRNANCFYETGYITLQRLSFIFQSHPSTIMSARLVPECSQKAVEQYFYGMPFIF